MLGSIGMLNPTAVQDELIDDSCLSDSLTESSTNPINQFEV